MTINTGYAIASIAALKALTPEERTDSYARLVKSVPAWYMFDAGSSDAGDDDAVLIPDDNPTTGRWIKSSGAGGGGSSFGGVTICTGDCAIGGGKAFTFYAPNILDLVIVPGFDIVITSGATSIQIHRWSQEPNTSLDGREFVAELDATGGIAPVDIDSTYRWISVFAKNPTNSDFFDGVCFTVSGNILTLISF